MATIELLRYGRDLATRLAEDLGQAERVNIAVASAELGALDALPLLSFVERGGELMLLAGTFGYGTEIALLRKLSGFSGARCRVYHAFGGSSFQPRLYVVDKGARRVVYVGGSDLTSGSFLRDVVAVVRIEGEASERELEQPMRLFEELFWSDLALPITDAFVDEYEALRGSRRAGAARAPDPALEARLWASLAGRIGEVRGRVSARRHLLVVTPKSYALCMATQSFGRKRQAELERYGKGDPFFFHVTGRGRGLRAMGMFLGDIYRDGAAASRGMGGGAPPFRKKFVVLAELGQEIKTRPILESRRPAAPKHWFNGFVQDSHTLSTEDFETLRAAFFAALAAERVATAEIA